jgi:hypothetical protein
MAPCHSERMILLVVLGFLLHSTGAKQTLILTRFQGAWVVMVMAMFRGSGTANGGGSHTHYQVSPRRLQHFVTFHHLSTCAASKYIAWTTMWDA